MRSCTHEIALLRALFTNLERWITPEELVTISGVKIETLPSLIARYVEAGYPVEFDPAAGVRLRQPDDVWCEEEVMARCTGDAGDEFPWSPLLLASTGSTNDFVRDQAGRGAAPGLLVAAAEQTKGRGRMGRSWQSTPGEGLYVSFLLRPGWRAEEVGQLGILTSVSVADAVEQVIGQRPSIKWPNDLLLNGKKLAGILIETEMIEGRIGFAVVGIGINVRQQAESFAPEIREIATSLRIETGTLYRRADVLVALMNAVQRRYRQPFESVRADWEAACLMLGQRIRLQTVRGEKYGMAMGLDESGALLLRTEAGLEEVISAGEMNVIR